MCRRSPVHRPEKIISEKLEKNKNMKTWRIGIEEVTANATAETVAMRRSKGRRRAIGF